MIFSFHSLVFDIDLFGLVVLPLSMKLFRKRLNRHSAFPSVGWLRLPCFRYGIFRFPYQLFDLAGIILLLFYLFLGIHGSGGGFVHVADSTE